MDQGVDQTGVVKSKGEKSIQKDAQYVITTVVNPDVNPGLWLINCDKCNLLCITIGEAGLGGRERERGAAWEALHFPLLFP